ncbi:hypothetical protein, partial [Streptomyces sp. NPDC051129]|uniref:hypothetical protein n=1 Tax=Streptomyces sp. NPDC051129 TaxID=3154639 RepID=UPI0034270AB5
ATIEAIRELKRRHPAVQTTLGLSNISFGLNPAVGASKAARARAWRTSYSAPTARAARWSHGTHERPPGRAGG